MSDIIIADLHLDEKESNAYMWGLFPWLQKLIIKYKVQRLIILGDLTEKKDNHSARLTNRIVSELVKLEVRQIIILKGNHDYVEETEPFFKFLSNLPYIEYVDKPRVVGDELFLPHSLKPEVDWEGIDFEATKTIYLHQSVETAVTSSGFMLESGLPKDLFDNVNAKIWSGDIHVPQKVGKVEYVGSPYPVYFGDDFHGRVILKDDDGYQEFHYTTPAKWSLHIRNIDELSECELKSGDQAKVTVTLEAFEKYEWSKIRKEIRDFLIDRGIEIHGLQMKVNNKVVPVRKPNKIQVKEKTLNAPEDVLRRFAVQEKLNDVQLNAGLELINDSI